MTAALTACMPTMSQGPIPAGMTTATPLGASTEIHSIGPFILGKTLGEGATGKVKLAFHKETGFKVGVKIIKKELLASKPTLAKKVQREIAILKLIDHPHVLKLYDVFETSRYLFLVMEYVEGGELFDYLVSKGSLDSHEALRFFQMMIHALDYCHSQHVCHRDLKPENLLLDSEKRLKIADYGMAAVCKPGCLLATSCGSPHYASPEVVMGKEYDGRVADVWSCGVILYALVSGKLPFDDDNIRVLLRKVKEGVFAMPPFLHRDIRDLISKMLVVDPAKRIRVQEIKQHPWFTSNHNPILTTPCSALEDMPESISPGRVDSDVVASLEALGMGTAREIEAALVADVRSQTRAYYRILLYQKNHPPSEAYERAGRGQGRTRSQTVSYVAEDVPREKPPSGDAMLLLQQQLAAGPGATQTCGPLLVTAPSGAPPIALDKRLAGLRPPSGRRERSCSVSTRGQIPMMLPRSARAEAVGAPVETLSLAPPQPAEARPITAPSTPTGRGITLPHTYRPEDFTGGPAPGVPAQPTMSCSPRSRLTPPPIQVQQLPAIPTLPSQPSTPTRTNGNRPTTPLTSFRLRMAEEEAQALQLQRLGTPPGASPNLALPAGTASPVLGSSPAKRTFWANFFKEASGPTTSASGLTQCTNADAPTNSDLGIHSTKPLAEIQKEIQRSLDGLGVNWQAVDGKPAYKAKYTSMEGTQNCQFTIVINKIVAPPSQATSSRLLVAAPPREGGGTPTLSASQPCAPAPPVSHFVDFKLDRGDVALYNDMCSVLEKDIHL